MAIRPTAAWKILDRMAHESTDSAELPKLAEQLRGMMGNKMPSDVLAIAPGVARHASYDKLKAAEKEAELARESARHWETLANQTMKQVEISRAKHLAEMQEKADQIKELMRQLKEKEKPASPIAVRVCAFVATSLKDSLFPGAKHLDPVAIDDPRANHWAVVVLRDKRNEEVAEYDNRQAAESHARKLAAELGTVYQQEGTPPPPPINEDEEWNAMTITQRLARFCTLYKHDAILSSVLAEKVGANPASSNARSEVAQYMEQNGWTRKAVSWSQYPYAYRHYGDRLPGQYQRGFVRNKPKFD